MDPDRDYEFWLDDNRDRWWEFMDGEDEEPVDEHEELARADREARVADI